MPSRRRAFTLVELLVVVGIVTLLIAILMPALAKARRQAQAVQCAANLRSLGHALTLYTQAYGYYPGAAIVVAGRGSVVWPVRLRAMLGGDMGVFYCPAQDERCRWSKTADPPKGVGRATAEEAKFGYEVGEPLLDWAGVFFSYGYNTWGAVQSGHGYWRMGLGWIVNVAPNDPYYDDRELRASRVKVAAEMIAIGDSAADGWSDWMISADSDFNGKLSRQPGRVHGGKANILFCDGHVEPMNVADLVHSEPGASGPRTNVRRLWNYDNKPHYGD